VLCVREQAWVDGDLKCLKELIAHLMRSGFEILSILWSLRFSSM